MSHFIGLVFSDDLDILERYDADRQVEPYVHKTKAELISEAWGLLELPHNKYELERIKTDEDAHRWIVEYYEYDLDENGNALSTYNKEAKWDWYEIGGRWNGFLPLKNGKKANKSEVGSVDWLNDETTPFCYITPDGEWHGIDEMLWWGFSRGDMNEEAWKRQFCEYVASLPDDTHVYAIDFHI